MMLPNPSLSDFFQPETPRSAPALGRALGAEPTPQEDAALKRKAMRQAIQQRAVQEKQASLELQQRTMPNGK